MQKDKKIPVVSENIAKAIRVINENTFIECKKDCVRGIIYKVQKKAKLGFFTAKHVEELIDLGYLYKTGQIVKGPVHDIEVYGVNKDFEYEYKTEGTKPEKLCDKCNKNKVHGKLTTCRQCLGKIGGIISKEQQKFIKELTVEEIAKRIKRIEILFKGSETALVLRAARQMLLKKESSNESELEKIKNEHAQLLKKIVNLKDYLGY